jgi:mycoredoxin
MPTPKIIVYGADWCGDCRRAKRFFDDYGVDYQWLDTDSDPQAEAFVRKVNRGNCVIPTIVFPDGAILVEPSNVQLAAKTGVEL